MIGGVCAVVKGGFSGICRRTQDGGDSRLRGNDGRGVGCDVIRGGNDGTDAGREIPAFAGMTIRA